MSTEKTKVVAKKETATIALPEDLSGSWGAEGYDNSDILIPRLLLMQGQSQFVADGKAKVGDIIKSTTGTIYGDSQNPVTIIPIMMWKDWTIERKEKNKWEYSHTEKVASLSNEREWTQPNGESFRRNTNLNFFVLLAKDCKMEQEAIEQADKTGSEPDVNAFVMPCHLKFSRTSYTTGKFLVTHFATMSQFKRPPAMKMFKLGAKKLDGDQGPYQVFTVENYENTPLPFIYIAKKWYDVLKVAKDTVKIDDAADVETFSEPDLSGGAF